MSRVVHLSGAVGEGDIWEWGGGGVEFGEEWRRRAGGVASVVDDGDGRRWGR